MSTHETLSRGPSPRAPARSDGASHEAAETRGDEARRLVEESRESWAGRSFMRDLLLGDFRFAWVHPFPEVDLERPAFVAFCEGLDTFLREQVDPDAIDATGEYPPEVVDGLRRLGAFGMKIGVAYGGLGFTELEYCRALELIARFDANLVALLSAHQSIGVPQPIMLFGTEEQRRRFLPRCARGEISAFALTERDVGSDPARLATTARRTPEGDYILRGEKLWTTNGTFGQLIVVMARHVDSGKISCFVVESSFPGVRVVQRCRFMGLRALENGVIAFDDVRVPKENLIGQEGRGLKIALSTLNTGRLSLPAAAVGAAKESLSIARRWCAEREQWGGPIGKHEAIAHKLADLAATTYAMESASQLASALAERPGYDIRLEAAAVKEWNTSRGLRLIDETMQIRGGRGYETAPSLAARGEPPIPVERMLRDFRINTIFEGSSEIMHLFMAREALDKHLSIAGDLIARDRSLVQKLRALPGIIAFYARWYPTRWLGWGRFPRYAELGKLAPHVRFIERRSRKLARSIFHGMLVHRAGLEKKQAYLFRVVEIAIELFVMSAVCSRASTAARRRAPDAREQVHLADVLCRGARRKIDRWFHDLWRNDDGLRYRTAMNVLYQRDLWLEEPGRSPRLGDVSAPAAAE